MWLSISALFLVAFANCKHINVDLQENETNSVELSAVKNLIQKDVYTKIPSSVFAREIFTSPNETFLSAIEHEKQNAASTKTPRTRRRRTRRRRTRRSRRRTRRRSRKTTTVTVLFDSNNLSSSFVDSTSSYASSTETLPFETNSEPQTQLTSKNPEIILTSIFTSTPKLPLLDEQTENRLSSTLSHHTVGPDTSK